MKKYWPYLILIAGAGLSITLAFISIKSFGGDKKSAATTGDATSTEIVAKKRPGFFNIFSWFPDFSALAPRIPTTPSPEQSGVDTQIETPGTDAADSGGSAAEAQSADNVPLPVDEYYYGEQPSRRAVSAPEEPPVENKVLMQHYVATGQDDPQYEYIIIYAPYENTAPYRITGLKIESVISTHRATIGGGVHLFLPNQPNIVKQDVYLKPGASAYIITGKSPLGSYSFEINKCLGYLEQSYDFYPAVPTDCPGVEEKELPKFPNQLDDICLDYIPYTWRCYQPSFEELPETLTYECKNFIREKFSYRSCVSSHQYDQDFYQGEWRIYLNRDQELWKTSREHLRLIDQSGKVLDEFSY